MLEKNLLQQDKRISKQDKDINMIFEALKKLLTPPLLPRKQIGFKGS
jgi:hypothetical protein